MPSSNTAVISPVPIAALLGGGGGSTVYCLLLFCEIEYKMYHCQRATFNNVPELIIQRILYNNILSSFEFFVRKTTTLK